MRQSRRCPVHADQRHGREAEELRSKIEKLADECLSNPTGDPSTDHVLETTVYDKLMEILDDTDARDSMVYRERQAKIAMSRRRR